MGTRVLDRIAAATSTLRTRAEATTRRENHGGEVGELRDRIVAAANELEKIAAKLEATL
jgi:hypothetical protein